MPSHYSTFELKDDLINLNYYTSRGFCLAKINQVYICLFYKVMNLSVAVSFTEAPIGVLFAFVCS